jgi:xylose isomerase
VGHAFAAGESPAEAAALLASKELLHYLHASDNTGEGGDWDMVSGTVHFWDWVELLYTLDRVGYQGWIGADIAPKFEGAVEVYRSNAVMINKMQYLLEQAGLQRLHELQQQGAPVSEIYRLLTSTLPG